jgi:hypothetical protein
MRRWGLEIRGLEPNRLHGVFSFDSDWNLIRNMQTLFGG